MNSSYDSSEPRDGTVIDLFNQWAEKSPERVAAEWQGESLTYGALRDASLLVSRAILLAGVLPRAQVPLLTQILLEMLPTVIGILRVGACYVPVDVALWSRARIEAALSELAAPVAVITSPCPGLQLPVIKVNFQRKWLVSSPPNEGGLRVELEARRGGMRAEDLAWIIFTSGTTGKPKGAMVYHRGIYTVCTVRHSQELEDAAEQGARCLLAFSIAFDGCTVVVWTSLSKGVTIVMASPSDFLEVSTTYPSLNLTPFMLTALDPSGSDDRVRYIFLGPEALKLELVQRWITKSREVFITYVLSETTYMISFGELHPHQEVPFSDLIPGFKGCLGR